MADTTASGRAAWPSSRAGPGQEAPLGVGLARLRGVGVALDHGLIGLEVAVHHQALVVLGRLGPAGRHHAGQAVQRALGDVGRGARLVGDAGPHAPATARRRRDGVGEGLGHALGIPARLAGGRRTTGPRPTERHGCPLAPAAAVAVLAPRARMLTIMAVFMMLFGWVGLGCVVW